MTEFVCFLVLLAMVYVIASAIDPPSRQRGAPRLFQFLLRALHVVTRPQPRPFAKPMCGSI